VAEHDDEIVFPEYDAHGTRGAEWMLDPRLCRLAIGPGAGRRPQRLSLIESMSALLGVLPATPKNASRSLGPIAVNPW
jgi:hypothetical protein